jgi:putative aldouronate transport system substrate-binding protein
MKRSIVALAIAIAVVGTAFAGGAQDGAKQAPAGESKAAPAKPAEPVAIDMWISKSVTEAADPPADWIVYKQIKEKFNVDLKLSFLPSNNTDQDAKINAAGAANQLPDFFYVNRDAWLKLVKAGLIAKTDDMLQHMPTRVSQHMAEPISKKIVSYKGSMYAIPTPGAMLRVEGMVIRKDWLNKLGLKAPKTTEEFLAVAKAFTEKDPDGNGKNDTYGFGGYIDAPGIYQIGLGPRFDWLFGAFGVAGVFDTTEASFGLNVRKPGYQEAIKYMNRIVAEKVIDPDWPNIKKDEFRARWKQGRFGIMWEQFAALAAASNYAPFDKNFPEGEWMVIEPPVGPNGLSSNGIDTANYRLWAVSAKAEKAGKKELIAKILEWMSTEGYYRIGFGEEGKNYNKNPDGTINIDGIAKELQYSHANQQPITQLRNLVFYNSPVEIAARYPYYKTANGRTMGPIPYWEAFKKLPHTPNFGSPLIDPPANAADFTRFYNEAIIKASLGQPVNWSDFLAGLDKLGAAKFEADAKAKLVELGLLD